MEDTIEALCKNCREPITIVPPWPPVYVCPNCGTEYHLVYD